MSYAFSYEVPASEQMYREVKEASANEPPEGSSSTSSSKSTAACATSRSGTRRRTGIASTPSASSRRCSSVLTAAGFTADASRPAVEELALIDVWV